MSIFIWNVAAKPGVYQEDFGQRDGYRRRDATTKRTRSSRDQMSAGTTRAYGSGSTIVILPAGSHLTM